VLPPEVANDPERVARFQREAEVLAALNHPNIAHLYGLERSGGTLALVMELVEGPSLADRIGQGAIPLDEDCRSPSGSLKRSKPYTSKGSSTGISSRRTSRCARTAR
jgi:serine/threonine protein kinase